MRVTVGYSRYRYPEHSNYSTYTSRTYGLIYLCNLVLSSTLKNDSKCCRYPKIVREILVGSQKYHLSISVVSLQIAMIVIG